VAGVDEWYMPLPPQSERVSRSLPPATPTAAATALPFLDGFRVKSLGYGVRCLRIWVLGSGFEVQGQGVRVWGLGFRV
jgi:hypothetical protein